MSGKTVLICGVCGQDGAYLAHNLLHKGYRVVGTTRVLPSAPPANLARLGISDHVALHATALQNRDTVRELLATIAPDEIYHLSGQSSVGASFERPQETWDSIVPPTLNLLEAVRLDGRPTRFFLAGSGDCFGDTRGLPADETTPFRPQSPYATAKAAATWAVATYRQAYDLFACTGILFNHESPLRPERFVTQKVIAAARAIAAGRQESLRLGNLAVVRDWGWAPEYVEAMARMLTANTPADYVIGSGRPTPLREFVRLAFHHYGLDWPEHVIVDDALFRKNEIPVSVADPAATTQQLGWKAELTIEDIIQRIAEGWTETLSSPQP